MNKIRLYLLQVLHRQYFAWEFLLLLAPPSPRGHPQQLLRQHSWCTVGTPQHRYMTKTTTTISCNYSDCEIRGAVVVPCGKYFLGQVCCCWPAGGGRAVLSDAPYTWAPSWRGRGDGGTPRDPEYSLLITESSSGRRRGAETTTMTTTVQQHNRVMYQHYSSHQHTLALHCWAAVLRLLLLLWTCVSVCVCVCVWTHYYPCCCCCWRCCWMSRDDEDDAWTTTEVGRRREGRLPWTSSSLSLSLSLAAAAAAAAALLLPARLLLLPHSQPASLLLLIHYVSALITQEAAVTLLILPMSLM